MLTKLFNIVQPNHVFFGQKDGIQAIAVRRMVDDLNFPITVNVAPTRRETDGLAMSSRNSFLSESERTIAPIIYKSLMDIENWFHRPNQVTVRDLLTQFSEKWDQDKMSLEYVTLSNLETGEDICEFRGSAQELTNRVDVIDKQTGVLLSMAAKLGKTRLIDCIQLKQNVNNPSLEEIWHHHQSQQTQPHLKLLALVNSKNISFSPYVTRVECVLKYKNLDYTRENCNFVQIPRFAEEYGWKPEHGSKPTAPILMIGQEKVISDSANIVDFIDKTFPDPPLFKPK